MVVVVVEGEGDVEETTASPGGEEGGDGDVPGAPVDEMILTVVYKKKSYFYIARLQ